VFYGLSNSNYTSYVDAGNSPQVTVTGLNPGTAYYFAVMAHDASGDESPFSNEVVYNVPALPVIVSQPLSQEINAGTTARFVVQATSAVAMTYQWYESAMLLPKATNTTLSIANVTVANSGSYTVVISNAGGSVTSDAATLAVVDVPVIASQPISASAGLGKDVDFSITVNGTPPFTFQWYTGAGKAVATGTKSTLRLMDVTAASAGSYYVIVQNAAGSVRSASATLTITNPLTVAAGVQSPTSNPFTIVAGVYNGLFYQTNGNVPNIAEQTAGMLGNCVIGTNGAYSAKVYVGGFSYPLAGTLNTAGNDTETIFRSANSLPNLYVTLQLDMTGESGTLSGMISNMSSTSSWTAPLLADLAATTSPVPSGTVTMTIPAITGALGLLTGEGNIAIQIATNGMATMAGALDDLTAVSQTVPISKEGILPLYFNIYGGTGLVEGWISIANGAASGTITWIRPPGILTGLLIPAGFTDILSVL
jgi:hypothetical protein